MHDLGITLGFQSSRHGPPPSNVAMLLTMPSSLGPRAMLNSSNKDFASIKSAVSNPSVNQL